MHEFETERLRRAIFGTGWDGSIVLEADTAGNWRNVKQPLAPGPMVFADVAGTVNLSALVDINGAGIEELSRLPRIGFVRAKAIIAHRTEHGPFSSVDELENVKGIGPATAIAIREYVTVIAQ
jgi:comEA protein